MYVVVFQLSVSRVGGCQVKYAYIELFLYTRVIYYVISGGALIKEIK